jgi:hypothetical protein
MLEARKGGKHKESRVDETTNAKDEWKEIKYLKSGRYKDGRFVSLSIRPAGVGIQFLRSVQTSLGSYSLLQRSVWNQHSVAHY